MKQLLVCLLLTVLAVAGEAQSFSRYIVRFRNKAATPYSFNNPSAFLSPRAIERRTKYGIALDSTDLPVTPRYIDSIRLAGSVTILNVSRWLNQVSIQTTDAAALNKINAFSFVQTVAPLAARMAPREEKIEKEVNRNPFQTPNTGQTHRLAADYFNYGLSYNQVQIHNGTFLHNIGLRGENMIIGMLDAGFRNYTSLRAFDSVNRNGQVLGTYDFVAREPSVVEDHPHGMQCFSVIAANIPGEFVGTAPKASFYLFRSEDVFSEYPIEEHNWVCAAERLDSAGGDVISSSLGYFHFDHPSFDYSYADMNGNTTISARGADLAARKGILVLNSAGNEGNSSWGKIVTPADGDSVVAVGAVNTAGMPAAFSSRGPSSDGQVKPDVTSVGVNTIIQTTSNTIGSSNGTSFSCPNIAGLATCLWQGFREFNNMKIVRALQQSGHRAANPDAVVGYGIPDVKKATLLLLKDFFTATVTSSGCSNTISWTSKDAGGMQYEIERKTVSDTTFRRLSVFSAAPGQFAAHTYSFVDPLQNVAAGPVQYRIRQLIDTARASFAADYMDTLSVTSALSCNNAQETLLLFPNPTQQNVILQVNNAEAFDKLLIHIYDAKGALVSAREERKPAAVTGYSLSLAHLAKGEYIVTVYANGKKLAATRLMKL